jgi:gamma-glutamylcyclotransferase (GGCT)/AIG2-like uncharacterized protein YtfP
MGNNNKHTVFVYGTLRKGQHNCYLMSPAEFVCPAVTADQFMMFGRGFPLCRRVEEEDDVGAGGYLIGEVWDVSDTALAKLDMLEGHPHFYERRKTTVVLEGGGTKEVLMYHWNEPGGTVHNERCTPKLGAGMDVLVHDWVGT